MKRLKERISEISKNITSWQKVAILIIIILVLIAIILALLNPGEIIYKERGYDDSSVDTLEISNVDIVESDGVYLFTADVVNTSPETSYEGINVVITDKDGDETFLYVPLGSMVEGVTIPIEVELPSNMTEDDIVSIEYLLG